MDIEQKIKQYLTEHGIKLTFVSKASGISINHLSKTFNDKRCLKANEFISICNALNLNLEYFK